MRSYIADYRTLGVAPNCDLRALKSARRRLTKQWHPDRFPAGDRRREAEERIKEINTAFDRLLQYHRQFGILPDSGPTHPRTSAAQRAADATVAAAAAAPAPRSHDGNLDFRISRPRWPRARLLRWSLALLALALLAELIHGLLRPDPELSRLRVQAPPPEPSLPVIAPQSAKSPSPDRRYFTLGSSLFDVYVVQGPPTEIEDDVWRYGNSRVYFNAGVVIGWDHDPSDPLLASLPAATLNPPETSAFTRGSTKAEVRAVQGAPLIETESLWDYGLSKVYFRDGRVVDWESSPMHPLKARK